MDAPPIIVTDRRDPEINVPLKGLIPWILSFLLGIILLLVGSWAQSNQGIVQAQQTQLEAIRIQQQNHLERIAVLETRSANVEAMLTRILDVVQKNK